MMDMYLWFTDPQYGIMSNHEGYESRSETIYNGVYMMDGRNEIKLLTSEIDAPNGIAFSPDEKIIYIWRNDFIFKVLSLVIK